MLLDINFLHKKKIESQIKIKIKSNSIQNSFFINKCKSYNDID